MRHEIKKEPTLFPFFEPIGYHKKKEIMRREKRHPANGYEKSEKRRQHRQWHTGFFWKITSNFRLMCALCVCCLFSLFSRILWTQQTKKISPGRWDRERERDLKKKCFSCLFWKVVHMKQVACPCKMASFPMNFVDLLKNRWIIKK
jgi:hypothetical protein